MTVPCEIFGIRVVSCTHNGWTPGWWVYSRSGTNPYKLYMTDHYQSPNVEGVWSRREDAVEALDEISQRYGWNGSKFEIVKFSEVDQ